MLLQGHGQAYRFWQLGNDLLACQGPVPLEVLGAAIVSWGTSKHVLQDLGPCPCPAASHHLAYLSHHQPIKRSAHARPLHTINMIFGRPNWLLPWPECMVCALALLCGTKRSAHCGAGCAARNACRAFWGDALPAALSEQAFDDCKQEHILLFSTGCKQPW